MIPVKNEIKFFQIKSLKGENEACLRSFLTLKSF